MEPTIYKPSAYKTPGIYNGSGGIYNGSGVYNDVENELLPYPKADSLYYDSKEYKCRKIGDLIITVEAFDYAGTFDTKYNIGYRYYKFTQRESIESLVTSQGFRLLKDSDVQYISDFVNQTHIETGIDFKDLIHTNTNWRNDLKGQNLTKVGFNSCGYYYYNSLYAQDTQFDSFIKSNRSIHIGSTGNIGFGGYANDDNYEPIIFCKDA